MKKLPDKKGKVMLKIGKGLFQFLVVLILLIINFGPDFEKCPIPFLEIVYLRIRVFISPIFQLIWSWKGHPVGYILLLICRIIILFVIIGSVLKKIKVKFSQSGEMKIKEESITQKYYHSLSENWGTYRQCTPGMKWKMKESFMRHFQQKDVDLVKESERLRICRVLIDNQEFTRDMLLECPKNTWKFAEDLQISYDSESDLISVVCQGQERILARGEDCKMDTIRIQYL